MTTAQIVFLAWFSCTGCFMVGWRFGIWRHQRILKKLIARRESAGVARRVGRSIPDPWNQGDDDKERKP